MTTQSLPHDLFVDQFTLTQGGASAWIERGNHADKCIHAFGTFGGATIRVQGSNEAVPDNGVNLSDPTGTAIGLTAAGLKGILECPRWLRVVAVGGDGTTDITAILFSKATR